MTRRPVCLACLFLMLCMYITEMLGIPVITGIPIVENTQNWIETQSTSMVYGMVDRCNQTEYGYSVYLNNSYLIYNSKKLPIKNTIIYIDCIEQINPGAFCLFSGKLERIPASRNPGEFNSRQYYACRHIYYQMKHASVEKINQPTDFIRILRGKLSAYLENIYQEIASEDAGVFNAIILGDKTELDDELKIRFQMAGIMHILSISGMHLSIIAMGMFGVLMKIGLGIWPAGAVSMGLVLGYGILTGGSSAILRAICMFVLMMIARITGKIYDMMTGLATAAIILILEAPAYLYSSSFLLSFSAIVGVGVVKPVLMNLFQRRRRKKTCNRIMYSFLSGISIQLSMLPVILWAYGEVSVAGLLLNLMIIPTAGALVTCGVLALAVGGLSIALGQWIIWPGRLLLHIYEWLSVISCKSQYATWIIGVPELWQILLYIAMILIAIILSSYDKRIYRTLAMVFIVVAVTVLTWRRREGLQITCLDVGQGDCIVVETPQRECYVIDCGSSSKKNVGNRQLISYLKYSGISEINAIFISHTDEDHISGIRELLDYVNRNLVNIRIKRLVLPELTDPPDSYKQLVKAAQDADVDIKTAVQGDQLKGKVLQWRVLSPQSDESSEDINEAALVLKLEYKEFQGLFMGDVGIETENQIQSLLEDVEFLKVGHHGSKHSTGEAFLNTIRPEIAAISCGINNRYGHPTPETIQRLMDAETKILRTDQMGALRIVIEDTGMKVKTSIKEKN